MPRSEGFTLVELLVALAVFALAALALLNLLTVGIRSAADVETAMLADIAAENAAVETMLAPPPMPGRTHSSERLAGRDFVVDRVTTGSADPAILRVELVARPATGGPAATLTLLRPAE